MSARVPNRLAAAADEARLGRLRAVDRGASPVPRAAGTGVAVVVGIVAAAVLTSLSDRDGLGFLRYVGLLALFLTFVPFGRALREVVLGATVTCVHERGVALGNNRAATILTWRRTRHLTRLRHGSTLLGWELLAKDDRTYRVMLRGTPEERAALATALEEAAGRAGVRLLEKT